MWGLKAWQIRQQREWIETLCMQRDTANRDADSNRYAVKRLAAQVEEKRVQVQSLTRANRSLREERRAQDKLLKEYRQRLKDAGLDTWKEAAESWSDDSVSLTLVPVQGDPVALQAQPVSESEFMARVHQELEAQTRKEQQECPHTVWKDVPDPRPGAASGAKVSGCLRCGLYSEVPRDECDHPGRLDTRENGGQVIVCTACGESLPVDETDGKEDDQ